MHKVVIYEKAQSLSCSRAKHHREVSVPIIQFMLPTQESTTEKGTRARTANHSAQTAHSFPQQICVLSLCHVACDGAHFFFSGCALFTLITYTNCQDVKFIFLA